jgi:23S rRNA (cytidine1920-2'-O)/16S rRNA (cytidine1409-2'-O)-methyltransferase
VLSTAAELKLGLRGLMASPLRGPAGNVEFLAWWMVGSGELEAGAAIAACMRSLEAEG